MSALQATLLDLNQLIPILTHWLHLVSAVIWIGGLAFLVMAVTPSLRETLPKDRVAPVAAALYRHFKPILGIALVVILFTGGINLHYVNQLMLSQTGLGVAGNAKYLTVFFLKLFLVLCVMTLFLYTILFKTEDVAEASVEEQEERMREPVPFQRTALWMGLFIILCAAALKHLHQ